MLIAACFSTATADDYTLPYLVFTDSEGTQTVVSVAELEITFSDGKLVAKNADGSTSIDLAALATMQFAETGEVTPVTPVTPEKVESGLAYAEGIAELTATLGEEFTEPTIENPNALSLVWTSSDENVATVDENGKVTLVAAGTATITATFDGNEEFEAGAASYTLTVSEAETDAISQLGTSTAVKVYTTSGLYVGSFESLQQAQNTLKHGLYIISANNRNYKLNIR